MKITPNINYNSFSKKYPNKNNFMNFRYLPKDSNNNYLLNNPFENNQVSNSEEKNFLNNLTNPQLSSLKLYKYDSNIIKKRDEEEKEEKYDESSFIPINELINTNFEEISKNNDFNTLKKFLPQMTYQYYKTKDLPNPKNKNMKLLLSKYQHLLKYLLKLEKNINKFNSFLDENAKKVFNPDLTNFSKEKSLNIQIEENNKKINLLYQKITDYKNIIINVNKNKKRSLASFVLIIKDNENNYYCDLCPNEIFQSYRDVQIHFLYMHKHILQMRKNNYEINNNIISSPHNLERNYLDAKIKNIEDELGTFIETLNKNNGKDNEILKNNINENNNLEKEENKENKEIEINDNNFMILEQKINILEENQKKNQQMLLENLDEFKKEIFSQLKSLKNNKKSSNPQPKNVLINDEQISKLKDIQNNNNKDMNITNITNINNNNTINNTTFKLGENYQDTTILDSMNDIFNPDEKNKFQQPKKPYINNNIFPIKEEEKQSTIEKEKDSNNNNIINNNNINTEEKYNLNYVINNNTNNNQSKSNVNNFAEKFLEREKNILFTHNKDNQQDFYEKYKILQESTNKQNNDLKKEDELIEKLNNKYNLNKQDLSKSGYNDIIKEIINKNENEQNENHKTYFNNILSFLEINKDLNSSIIKQ